MNLARVLGGSYVFVSKREKDSRMKTLAVYSQGRFRENFEFEASKDGSSADVELFSPEKDSSKNQIFMPLRAHSGELIGGLAVVSRKDIRSDVGILSMLKVFCLRAVAELERKKSEEREGKKIAPGSETPVPLT